MIPIRDDNPARRPAVITALLVIASSLVYFLVQPSSPGASAEFLYAQAAIPCEVVTGAPLSAGEITGGVCSSAPADPVFPAKSVPLSVVESIFLHGSIGHLIGNMWVLWIFGNNVEDRMGRLRFLIFYLVVGVLATGAHVAVNPTSVIPVVGASGAIAGVMGAYLVLFPGARVVSIVPPLFFWPFRVPAFLFLGLWFFLQFGLAGGGSGIAWEAHVAGFALGALYALLKRSALLGSRRR